MQSFGDLFANNRLLAIGVVLAAVAVILAVGIVLFRLVFGRRLHMSGGRTRQPRLGVVDAFDLDRQRQLVLIRRDNVEHLLMIGGPNDVVIEAAIVRTSATVTGRDKDTAFSPSVGIPAPMPQQAALPAAPQVLPTAAFAPGEDLEAGSNGSPAARLAAEPKTVAAAEPVRPGPGVEVAPVPTVLSSQPSDTRIPATSSLPPLGPRPTSRPTTPLPPRPPMTPLARPAASPTPRANLSRATPAVGTAATDGRAASTRVEPLATRVPENGSAAAERSAPEVSREPPASAMRFPPSRGTRGDDGPSSLAPTVQGPIPEDAPAAPRAAVPPRPTPTGPVRTLPPRPTTPATSAPQAPAAPVRSPMPSLGSLEEEMAKLLGRPMPPSDTSGSGT